MVRTEFSQRRATLEAAVAKNIFDIRGRTLHADPPDRPSKSSPASTSLRDQIAKGLRSTERVVPGQTVEDEQWAYTKTIPTIVLYDDEGLSIYDEITKVTEYYPFEAELRIFKTFGREITLRLFGLPTEGCETGQPSLMRIEGILDDATHESNHNQNNQEPDLDARKERWGDFNVGGAHNNGVNGDVGLDDGASGGPTIGPLHATIVELGAGSLKKTSHLLKDVAGLLPTRGGPNAAANLDSASYYALDLELRQLQATLTALAAQHPDVTTPSGSDSSKVHIRGLCATYDEGLSWLARSSLVSTASKDAREGDSHAEHKTSILWLGSSIGNFSSAEATNFLKTKVAPALRPGDTLLVGIDNCKVPERVVTAYNDPRGVTAKFILNGGAVAVGRELGVDVWNEDAFEYAARWNAGQSRHEAYLRARHDFSFSIPGDSTLISIKAGELIFIEASYKYTHAEAYDIFLSSGLRCIQKWTDPSPEALHTLYLLEKPAFGWLSTGSCIDEVKEVKKNQAGVPTREEWMTLWKAWDTVTLGMIPREMLHTKPIDLRHICLFYLGHIPVFADIHISRYLKEPFTEPSHFSQIFERGIDPDMDDPSQCHDHSIVPDKKDEWPTLKEILEFRDRFRKRLFDVYAKRVESKAGPDRFLGRILSMIFEHEGLHLETLLYMLVQLPPGSIRSPPGFAAPDYPSLSRSWNHTAAAQAASVLIDFPSTTFSIGHDDREKDDHTKAFDPDHEYGWDNENPRRQVRVKAFKLSGTPITNAQYRDFLISTSNLDKPCAIPSSWIHDGNDWSIRTVYGPVPFSVAQHWPCQASASQLSRFASHAGGRLPTADELALFFTYCPPDTPANNVGFRNWHPVPDIVPTKVINEEGKESWSGGGNGGVWEWTSTDFAAHAGYEKSIIYPGYSSDFFDGAHKVVLGASWATIPRIAGRASMRNWYQANYPYVFAGARVAYDRT